MEQITELSHKEFLKIDRDYLKAARVADLLYVTDKEEGILRTKKGNGFSYSYKAKTLTDEATLQRIKKNGHSACVDKCLDLP